MKDITNYGDSRQTAFCVHCGGRTETRDHIPSKVFLDEPYPGNLPIVLSCQSCNEGFSLDEEYVACLIDCVLAGSVDPARLGREKTRRILASKPALATRIDQARKDAGSETVFGVEEDRVSNVVLKLARGHVVFELNEPHIEKPYILTLAPLSSMSIETRKSFELLPRSPYWPEVGSRAMQRLLMGTDLDPDGWLTVQPGRYRFAAHVGDGIMIRIVLSEYLGCEVVWEP